MSVSPVCMSVYYLCALCLHRPEEGFRFPGLELQTSVNHLLDAGNQTQVPCGCMIAASSEPLCQFSSPNNIFH